MSNIRIPVTFTIEWDDLRDLEGDVFSDEWYESVNKLFIRLAGEDDGAWENFNLGLGAALTARGIKEHNVSP